MNSIIKLNCTNMIPMEVAVDVLSLALEIKISHPCLLNMPVKTKQCDDSNIMHGYSTPSKYADTKVHFCFIRICMVEYVLLCWNILGCHLCCLDICFMVATSWRGVVHGVRRGWYIGENTQNVLSKWSVDALNGVVVEFLRILVCVYLFFRVRRASGNVLESTTSRNW